MGGGNSDPIIKHLVKVWRSTGKKPKPIADLPEPPFLSYLYDLYCGLPIGEFSMVELKAWCDLTNTDLTKTEVEILSNLNYWYLKAVR